MSTKKAPAATKTGDNKGRSSRAEMKSRRQIERQQRKRRRQITVAGAIIIAAVALGGIIWAVNARAQDNGTSLLGNPGRAVTVMADTSHYPEGEALPIHNSNPPTSGPHYASTYQVGFYDEARAATLPQRHEGYLVHNLEHGYVIFWYNCEALPEGGSCDELKQQIQGVMDEADNFKVIGFPWPAIDKPVVMTSWGRILEFDSFDPETALAFVRHNRNKAPEPNAP